MSAEAQIKSFVDRVLRLKEEQDAIGQDIRDIYAEAKSLGFDKTQLGNVVSHVRKVEKKGRDAINEGNAIFDMYLAAYEGTGTPVATRAHTHEAEPHDPETGEILESVQSHEALVLSAPAESASGEISATNQESGGMKLAVLPSSDPHEADESGSPIHESDAPTSRPEPAVNPAGHIDTPATGQASDQTDGGAIGGVMDAKCRLPDAAGVEPSPSVTFTNPKCLNPKTCPSAHSRTACFDCVMEYAKRPAEEQKRLWAKATGVAA